MEPVAALPMYDWPECRVETDAQWAAIRDRLRNQGIDVPEQLARRNSDMPAVPGGISDGNGHVIAPDPAKLPRDELDLHTLWRHPALVIAQTCWGPMEETSLAAHVGVVGQPDYSGFEGGEGIFYRSAIIARRQDRLPVPVPPGRAPHLRAEMLRGRRFAFNSRDSMSGLIALRRDLTAMNAIESEAGFDSFWSDMIVTGGHRLSVIAVAEGRADIAAIDCRTLDLCRRFEPAFDAVTVIGWTAARMGLPFVSAVKFTPVVRAAIASPDGVAAVFTQS